MVYSHGKDYEIGRCHIVKEQKIKSSFDKYLSGKIGNASIPWRKQYLRLWFGQVTRLSHFFPY